MPAPTQGQSKETGAKAAPRSRGAAAAAVAEVTPDPAAKTVEFRGLTLTLPDALPATILFDVTELEAEGNVMAVFRLLRSALGPDQFTEVRNKIAADDDVVVVVDGLLSDIFGQYGMSLGESPASQDS